MKHNETYRNKGFSLIELLVVVAIIGVLAAVAIPAYQKYQADAAQNTAKLSAKTIYKAVAVCLASGTVFSACTNTTINGTLDQTCSSEVLGTDAEGCQVLAGVVADSGYCIATKVKTVGYCVDTKGISKIGTAGCGGTSEDLGTCV